MGKQKVWSRIGRWAVGIAIAALSIWLLVRGLHWRDIAVALADADYRWVIAGVLGVVAGFFTRARRWQLLLWQARPRLRPTITGLLVGQAVNMILPMRGGSVVRAAWLGSEGAGVAASLGSIAVEKVWDLLALLTCGLVLLLWIPLPRWFARSVAGTALLLLLAGGLLWGWFRWYDRLFRWLASLLARLPVGWGGRLLPALDRLTTGLAAIRRSDVSAQALLWTGLTWGLGVLINLAVLAAFGIPSLVAALLLLVTLMAGGAVPVPVPGQLGIFEGICVVSLALLGVPRDRALAVGLVLHLVAMGPPLVAAVFLLLLSAGLGEQDDEAA